MIKLAIIKKKMITRIMQILNGLLPEIPQKAKLKRMFRMKF